jgi:hypothetical protein
MTGTVVDVSCVEPFATVSTGSFYKHERGRTNNQKHREGDEKTNGAKTVGFFVPLAVDAGVHCTNEPRHADTIDFFDVPTTSTLLWHEPCTFFFVPLAAARVC